MSTNATKPNLYSKSSRVSPHFVSETNILKLLKARGYWRTCLTRDILYISSYRYTVYGWSWRLLSNELVILVHSEYAIFFCFNTFLFVYVNRARFALRCVFFVPRSELGQLVKSGSLECRIFFVRHCSIFEFLSFWWTSKKVSLTLFWIRLVYVILSAL